MSLQGRNAAGKTPVPRGDAHTPGLSDSKSPGLSVTPLPPKRAATRGHLPERGQRGIGVAGGRH